MVEKLGPATIYGLSTEGYLLAAAMARHGVQTTLIDENLQMGMELKPEIATHYTSVNELVEAEPLLGLTPSGAAVANASLVFFAPKIRKTDEEAKVETLSRLREVVRNLSKGSTLIYCVPTGLGENFNVISIAEKLSGLSHGEDFDYVYAPLQPGSNKPSTIGIGRQKPAKRLIEGLRTAGLRATFFALGASELLHAKAVLSRCTQAVAELDLYRKISDGSERSKLRKGAGYKDIFFDELSQYLFDLKAFLATFETGDPLLYLGTGVLKGIEGYSKYLIDELRAVVRRREIKASKTRIYIAWSVDKYEMRGERLSILSSLLERLRDYIGDITTLNAKQERDVGDMITSTDKTAVVVAFSADDYAAFAKVLLPKKALTEAILLKANLLVEEVTE